MKRVALSWSSGKDCAWALHILRQTPGIEVVALITTFNHSADRVAMHAVRRRLVQSQAMLAGLPLWPVELPWPCSNEVYEDLMRDLCSRAVAQGVTAVAFGDLFLEDVRRYRETQMQGTGLEPLFPLWNLPTRKLADDMLHSGLEAIVTCVDPKKLDRGFAGREYSASFLASLPANVDPCGENGEFHTFVTNAPAFSTSLSVEVGDIVERDGFVFADVV